MIQIKILNHNEIVKNKKGWFTEKVLSFFDIKKTVENHMIEDIKKGFEENGIKAVIERIED